jgi:hypothetical protein
MEEHLQDSSPLGSFVGLVVGTLVIFAGVKYRWSPGKTVGFALIATYGTKFAVALL